MPEYICECCNYLTKNRSHFQRHKLTKKHANNTELMKKINKEKTQLMTRQQRTCVYCNKIFSTVSCIKRHIKNGCKKNKETEESLNSIISNTIKQPILEHKINTVNNIMNTNISINGRVVKGDPMKNPVIKNILINSFSHPYFKNNIKVIPVIFFNDAEFLFYFNNNHNVNIQKSDLEL